MRLHMADVLILGGGFVGQLVQLSIPTARMFDSRKKPRHHMDTRIGPQYLWEPIPGVNSISFPVITTVDGKPPTDPAILRYKKKIGKEHDGGDWGLQFQHETTGWWSELPIPRVDYEEHVESVWVSDHLLIMKDGRRIPYDVLINTIPLPAFLKLCDVPPRIFDPHWKYDPIYMTQDKIEKVTASMMLNYRSNPEDPFYRDTIYEDRRYYETLNLKETGVSVQTLVPGKIHRHPESESILTRLGLFQIYCFGRFAGWRPDELAHETWRQIEAWKGTV